MMKKITTIILAIAIGLTAALAVPVGASGGAVTQDPICDPDSGVPPEQKEAAGCTSAPGDIHATLRGALNSVYAVVGIVAVGVIVFGGFRYSVSQGDSGKLKKAKDTIMYAIIGLIVVLSAFAITNFVLGAIQ